MLLGRSTAHERMLPSWSDALPRPTTRAAARTLTKHVRWYLVGLHLTAAAQSRRGLYLSHVSPPMRGMKTRE